MTGRRLILATGRLRATTWLMTDTDELFALHSDPVVMAGMTTGVQTRDQTQVRLQAWIDEQSTRAWSKWRLTDHDGNLLGRAGFGTSHGTGHRELGYLLRREAWGQGLASEIASALVNWHQEHPDPAYGRALVAYVYDTNTASQRVLLNAGFHRAGQVPEDPRMLLFISDP